jgi:hypothetical protein
MVRGVYRVHAAYPTHPLMDPTTALSPHLTWGQWIATRHVEFVAEQNTSDPEVLWYSRRTAFELVEPIFALVGRCHLNSGYRSLGLNRALGSPDTSAHRQGRAADLVPLEMALAAAFQLVALSALPFDQLIYEVGWLHVSGARAQMPPRRQVLTYFSKADGYQPWDPTDPRWPVTWS